MRLTITKNQISVSICLLLAVNLFGQEPNYLKDFKPGEMDKLMKSAGSAKQGDSVTSAVEEDDKLFYLGKDGFPTTQKGKYIFLVDGQTKNELKTGIFKFWAIDAKNVDKRTLVKELTFANDILQGEFRYYYPNGKIAQIGNYVQGKIKGKTSIYYPDGKLFSEFSYNNDKINGIRKDFYPSGNTKLIINILDGKPHGAYQTFFPNGKLEQEWNYQHGQAHGRYQYYYESGQIWIEKEYKDNLLWNVSFSYDSAGKSLDKGTLKDGNGTVRYYDEKGKLYSIEYYEKGQKVKEENKN
jgi:antitoxin component YwqK of YwqJK toxin-antitoxin module